MLSYLGVAAGGSVAIMLTAGLLTGIGYAAQVHDAGEIVPLIGASLAMVPALLVLSTLAAAVVGVRPQWSAIAWAAVAFAAVVGLLSETLNLPQWTRDFSPFQHVPAVPAAPWRVVLITLVLLLAVAGGLTAVALTGIERRDIARR